MIRSSIHKLIDCNKAKIDWLDNLFVDYKKDLATYINCGYQIDADYNAAINIHNRGVYSPFSQEIHYFS